MEIQRSRVSPGPTRLSWRTLQHTQNVLDVSFHKHPAMWRILIVTEFWEDGKGQTIHTSKWLKLIEGKSSDLLKWIQTHRDVL